MYHSILQPYGPIFELPDVAYRSVTSSAVVRLIFASSAIARILATKRGSASAAVAVALRVVGRQRRGRQAVSRAWEGDQAVWSKAGEGKKRAGEGKAGKKGGPSKTEERGGVQQGHPRQRKGE
eukprot:174348-Chlamydomonas_euryale.AAC.1